MIEFLISQGYSPQEAKYYLTEHSNKKGSFETSILTDDYLHTNGHIKIRPELFTEEEVLEID